MPKNHTKRYQDACTAPYLAPPTLVTMSPAAHMVRPMPAMCDIKLFWLLASTNPAGAHANPSLLKAGLARNSMYTPSRAQ